MVDAEQVHALRARSPYNIAHVECSTELDEESYRNAANTLRRWQEERVLKRDHSAAYYVYEQRFAVHDELHVRRSFFARMRLQAYTEGHIRPHESTMAGPVQDRLQLLRSTTTNVSPIFAMFDDKSGTARGIFDLTTNTPPLFESHDDHGNEHRLWVLDDPTHVDSLTKTLDDSVVTIADGHHRYTTALEYSVEQASEPASWVMTGLVPLDEPGLIVLPTHRLVKTDHTNHNLLESLSDLYVAEDVTPPNATGNTAVKTLWDRVQENANVSTTFGVLGIEDQRTYLLKVRSAEAIAHAMPAQLSRVSQSLDVSILTETILRPILGIDHATLTDGARVDFTEHIETAWDAIQSGRFQLAFLVNPVRVQQVTEVADAGELMPQKATFFYPKLHTGMVLNPLD